MVPITSAADRRSKQPSLGGVSNGWIPMIIQRTDTAIDNLVESLGPTGSTTDMYLIGRSLVLEIVVRTMFGDRLAAHSAEFGDLFQRAQDYLEAPAYRQIPHRLPFTARARVRNDRRAFDTIVDDEIAHLRAHPSGDVLNVLASLVAEGELTDAEMRDQVNSLIGAGYDTTAASLAWMLWRATIAPGLWDHLRDEADAVFGRPGERVHPDHTTLARLELADRVMRETLRLHPAGVVSPREAVTDVVVGGYRIPKGTFILWSAYLAGRDSDAWGEPLRFDPDRFIALTPDQQATADTAWVPFGRGARNCIGFALAQMELTLIIGWPNASTSPRSRRQSLGPSAWSSTAPVAVSPCGCLRGDESTLIVCDPMSAARSCGPEASPYGQLVTRPLRSVVLSGRCREVEFGGPFVRRVWRLPARGRWRLGLGR